MNCESYEEVLEDMSAKLGALIPPFELSHKAKQVVEINRLKREKNAIILGHNYMEPALYHSVADVRGDSLELCRKAAETDKDVLVFAGVQASNCVLKC